MALSREEIHTELAAIVEDLMGVPAAEVTLEKSFTDDLDVDSLGMVEIAQAAQDKFGAPIPDDEIANLKTVGDVVEYLAKTLA